MLDLEDELRRVLHEHCDGVGSSPDFDARVTRRLRSKVRTRRVAAALLSVAVIAGVTALTAAALPHGHGTPTVRVGPGPATSPSVTVAHRPFDVRAGHWAAITEPPSTGAFASVWTGDRLIVAFRAEVALRFAAYDPATDAWSRVPDPPIELQAPFNDSSTFVRTGATILVWGYENHGTDTFSGHHRLLSYDPATQRWRELADPPVGPLIQAHPIWTGNELIVWGGNFNGEGAPAQGAAYDPATNRWRAIAPAPLSTRENPMIVWTGHEMLVWGGFANGTATTADRLEGAAYDPATDSWRALPVSGAPRVELAAAAWTGHEMVVFGYGTVEVGVAYDPAANTWRHIAASPLEPREQTASAWTGHELVVWGGTTFTAGQTLADGAAYDPVADRWQLLPKAPLTSRFSATMAVAGTLVVVLGGNGPSAPGVSLEPLAIGAAAFRP